MMSFYNTYKEYQNLNFDKLFDSVTDSDVLKAIHKDNATREDLLILLSPKAEIHLEEMAQVAKRITVQQFGKAILLYTPMYISNYCDNYCIYCGFNVKNKVLRKKLTLEEIEEEAKAISKTGLRHILLLTGDSRKQTPLLYIKDSLQILKRYFSSISIEIYPLEEEEYKEVITSGVDGLTIYQETYDEKLYDEIHVSGPKKNYHFRIDSPERGCKAWMRNVNIGSLLGLADWRKEVFYSSLHAAYLQNKYPDTEIAVSFPRMRPHEGAFDVSYPVSDKHLVQIITASRIFNKRVGITISTREKASFRNNIIGLGVTKMSVGSTTAVGGHTQGNESKQFEIADERNVEESKKMILSKGYEPVFKDWQNIYS